MTFPFGIWRLLHKRSVAFTIRMKRRSVVTYAPDLWVHCAGEPCSASRGRLDGAGLDQADLVGEDHRLDTIAEPQLVEHVGDVRLDGGFADLQLASDLGIGEAAAQQAHYFLLALRQ